MNLLFLSSLFLIFLMKIRLKCIFLFNFIFNNFSQFFDFIFRIFFVSKLLLRKLLGCPSLINYCIYFWLESTLFQLFFFHFLFYLLNWRSLSNLTFSNDIIRSFIVSNFLTYNSVIYLFRTIIFRLNFLSIIYAISWWERSLSNFLKTNWANNWSGYPNPLT